MGTRLLLSSVAVVFVVLIVGACGGTELPPTRSTPVAEGAPSPTTASSSASGPTHALETSDPTALSDADKTRDKALAPRMEAIIDAYASFDAQVAPDGKKFLFRSNRGGIPEVFVADMGKPSSPAKAVVPGPERVSSARFSYDGKWIVFRRDKGADENFRIYRIKPDGTELTELTPGDSLHRDDALLARKKPDLLVFTARRSTSPETTVSIASLSKPGDAKVVFTDPSPDFGAALSPDGAHALLLRFVSPTDQVIFDVDLAAGKSKRVYPPDGKAAGVQSVDYSADGKRIFVATDEGGESNSLLALDATTYKETGRYVQDRPKSANIFEMLVSPRGDRIVVGVDSGNKNDIRILDAQTLKLISDLKLPLGATSLSTFTEDGKSFTISQSLPDAPPDIYLVSAQTGALQAMRDDKRPGLGDLAGLNVSVTAVPAHDGLSIPVHYYLPKEKDPRKLPVIVHFHGGPSASSRISWNWMARAFTSQGFAFVEPNIRGSTGFGRAYEMADNREKRVDALKDVATINTWLRNQAWADPDRLIIYGGSYGGYLVLMGLTRQAAIWRAGVDIVGVANLFTFLKSTDQAIRSGFVDEFGDLEKDQKLLEEFSPMRDKDKIVAPLFVYQGQNDPRVPRPESDQVVASLRGRHVPVEYMVAPDEGHSLDHRNNRVEFATRVTRFLNDHINAK